MNSMPPFYFFIMSIFYLSFSSFYISTPVHPPSTFPTPSPPFPSLCTPASHPLLKGGKASLGQSTKSGIYQVKAGPLPRIKAEQDIPP